MMKLVLMTFVAGCLLMHVIKGESDDQFCKVVKDKSKLDAAVNCIPSKDTVVGKMMDECKPAGMSWEDFSELTCEGPNAEEEDRKFEQCLQSKTPTEANVEDVLDFVAEGGVAQMLGMVKCLTDLGLEVNDDSDEDKK